MIKLQKKFSKEEGYLEIDNSVDKIRVKNDNNDTVAEYCSIAELYQNWEDYEEQCWYITSTGEVREGILDVDWRDEKRIGNYFGTKKEAGLAVLKLEAWQRLEKKGFRFIGWKCTGSISFTFDSYCGDGQPTSAIDDLDLLFGGEE